MSGTLPAYIAASAGASWGPRSHVLLPRSQKKSGHCKGAGGAIEKIDRVAESTPSASPETCTIELFVTPLLLTSSARGEPSERLNRSDWKGPPAGGRARWISSTKANDSRDGLACARQRV